VKRHRDFSYVKNAVKLGKQKLAPIAILLVCVSLLAIARWLEPDPRGHGTHEQLRLPPCAMYKAIGVPCITCGMTTAFAHAAHGEFGDAFVTQPFGALLFFLCVGLVVDSVVSLAAGRSVFQQRLPWKWIVAASVVLLFAAWGYKILKAEG